MSLELVPSPTDAVEAEEVWIAMGLHKPWRVVSLARTFGEFDDLDDARALLELLVKGDPSLRRLT